MKFLYGATITLSAALLFSIEPMMARALLPQLGGSSAIWLTALTFYQLVLLCGYAYTVLLAKIHRASTTHLVLLVAATAALLLTSPSFAASALRGSPQLRLFTLLAGWIGLPFLTLSTTTPLLQAWYAQRENSALPYRFFALSNVASLAALLAYPVFIEPHLSLRSQLLLWKGAFVLYACLAGMLALRVRSASLPRRNQPPTQAPTRRLSRVLWFALPAIASFQLAAVTAHLTQDVASMPLLWVLPLAAYLLSFVLAFEFPRLYHRHGILGMLGVLLFALGYLLSLTDTSVPLAISLVFFLAELFFASWFCHAELFALRPQATTAGATFYLYLAAGGAAGTLAVAILSPLLTNSNFDLPAAFLLTLFLLLAITWHQGWKPRLLWSAGVVAGVYLFFVLNAAYQRDTLFRGRNFYGSLRVKQSLAPAQAYLSRILYNGAIQHGMQWFSTDFHHTPLTYYTFDSGVGLAMRSTETLTRPRHIGVIGLGAGTLAAYGRPGDQITFYEINPMVIDVAQHLFTYTRDTPAAVHVIAGDARLSLERQPPQSFDLLVVDAFSGDSIPTHLLIREAFDLYRRHLAPGAILAFHISNQYLDLTPVLARLAEATRTGSGPPWAAREFESGPDDRRGEALAYWVLLTARPEFFREPAIAATATSIHTQPNVKLWTDQSLSLLPILRWKGRHN